jgi:hypothetical protein
MSPGARAYCDRFCGTLWSMDADPHMTANRRASGPLEFPEWEVFAAPAQLPTSGAEVGLDPEA